MANQASPQGTMGGAAGINLPSFSQIVAKAKAKPMIPMIAAAGILAAVAFTGVIWSQSANYQTIYSNLSESDGGKIINELEKRNIPYKFSQNGSAIMVPGDQVYALRLQLAEKHLPEGGNVGFELMDKQQFGISQFAEHVNYQRSLEGELAKSIESLGPVEKARVHLVMQKESVFARNREPASASVIVNLRSGREISQNQVDAIAHMVSSGVQGLPADSVTVVDQTGRLLTKNSGTRREFDEAKLTYTDEIENKYQKQIENILVPILGLGNIKAQVVAQIDFSDREHTSERYAPNSAPNQSAMRSQKIFEDYNGEGGAKGIPGALSNSPPNSPAVTTADGKPNENYPASKAMLERDAKSDDKNMEAVIGTNASMSRDKTINYEVDKTVEHVKSDRGEIQRLSAAVVVNYKMVTGEDGEAKSTPLSPEEIDQIKKLVRQAIGFSAERGDELEVINSQFTKTVENSDEAPWWKTPAGISLLSEIAKYGLLFLIVMVVWLGIIRPARKRQALEAAEEKARIEAVRIATERAEEEAKTQGGSAEYYTDADGNTFDREGKPYVVPVRARKHHRYESSLKGFIEMADKEPELVATILKGWMNR
ncbi:flagellar basal-body MS-ring/collar protein FliF [Pseudomonas aeruginosa]